MGTSFEEVRRKQLSLADEMHRFSGVEKSLVLKIIQYAHSLPDHEKPDVIDELVFKAQMGLRFGITSTFHLQCVYEAAKRRSAQKEAVHVYDFVKLMCLFQSNNLEEKADYVFSVYDITHDGVLTINELTLLLKNSVVEDSSGDIGAEDDGLHDLKELVELVFNLLDENKDGILSLDAYRVLVRRNDAYLQLCGQVLPDDIDLDYFMGALNRMTDTQVKVYFRKERMRCLNLPPDFAQVTLGEKLYPVRLPYVDIY